MDKKIYVRIDQEIKDIVPDYLANRQKDVLNIRKLLNECDFENIRTIGHKMRGSGKLYGFEQITNLGEVIEKGAGEKNSTEIQAGLSELENYLKRVEIT
jgi:HPt (histidine-containing phosphotransfer) domain-containing protein